MRTTNAQATATEIAGEAQQLAAEMLGKPGMKLVGQAKVLCGKSQRALNNAADITLDNIAENPGTAVGIAAAIGFALGAAWFMNRK
jgi:ElaB/YqjD/DUF883 family membrane-anchored ribosome-binding protein